MTATGGAALVAPPMEMFVKNGKLAQVDVLEELRLSEEFLAQHPGMPRPMLLGKDAPVLASRQELADLARRLRQAADSIDALIEKRPKNATDANGDPTFRFAAKVSIPDDWRLTSSMNAYAMDRGFTSEQIVAMGEAFVIFYRKGGKKWQDWARVWMDWVRREQKRNATAPRQRVSSGQMDRW